MSEVQLIVEFGKGPLGRVWLGRLATGDEAGRLVVVRRLDQRILGNDGALRSAHAADVAKRLRHPRLLKLLGVSAVEGELRVVSEHVEGEYLSALRALAFRHQEPLPVGVAVRIVLDALRAARAAKAELKKLDPRLETRVLFADSIVVARFGDTLLCDVAVANAIARVPAVRFEPEFVSHLAPEELGDKPCDADRADVYTAGAILLELIMNRPLFAGDDPELVSLELEEKSASRLEPFAVRPLAALISRSLQHDADQRFATPTAMVAALEALPRELVATEERVQRAVEDLARERLEHRRRFSDAPPVERIPSSRPTGRPESGVHDFSTDLPTTAVRRHLLFAKPGDPDFKAPNPPRLSYPESNAPPPTVPPESETHPAPESGSKPSAGSEEQGPAVPGRNRLLIAAS